MYIYIYTHTYTYFGSSHLLSCQVSLVLHLFAVDSSLAPWQQGYGFAVAFVFAAVVDLTFGARLSVIRSWLASVRWYWLLVIRVV